MRRKTSRLLFSLVAFAGILQISEAVKCLDCVGADCMGSFCEGKYCVLSQYAPRWGTLQWGTPEVVKGCINGSMISKNIRDHCEIADGEDEPFTCFCNNKDNCNGGRTLRKLEVENVDLVTCVCKGPHCNKDKTCVGELCSFVKNHRTKKIEQGCVNASVPLVERRAIGSCMAPPITGAMHHTVAKDAQDLLYTESCICASDYCNSDKPEIEVEEKEKCEAWVEAKVMGNVMKSKKITCDGEYCFKVNITSKLGHISNYVTYGCASFTGEDQLPEELDPTGCAEFESENLSVKTCFQTKDKDAVRRALANKQVPEGKKPSRKGSKKQKQMEIEYESEEDDNAEEEEEDEKPARKSSTRGDRKKEEKVKEESKEEEEDEDEKEEKKEKGEEKEEKEEKKETMEEKAVTAKSFIFEKPTQPPIPDDSNTTMIAVFALIILCILVSGIFVKFELHKKLQRSSYDTVAGG